MHILVSNDDGVQAPGLLALAQAMRQFGKVTVIAPDRNWSVTGHSKTLDKPLRVNPVTMADGSAALSSDGSPSDCVALALLGLIEEPVDLVVTGINPYANLGHDLTYSGTVTSAMEAAIWGLPAVAFSLHGTSENPSKDYSHAARVAAEVVSTVMNHGMPRHHLLSVNVPNLPYDQIQGMQITRQGLREYHDRLVCMTDPSGKPFYWIGGDAPTSIRETGTDYGALEDGYVSITPLQLDFTAYRLMDELSAWGWPRRGGSS